MPVPTGTEVMPDNGAAGALTTARIDSDEFSRRWVNTWVALALVSTLMRQILGVSNLIDWPRDWLQATLVGLVLLTGLLAAWSLLESTPMRGRGWGTAVSRFLTAGLAYLASTFGWLMLQEMTSHFVTAGIGAAIFVTLSLSGVALLFAGSISDHVPPASRKRAVWMGGCSLLLGLVALVHANQSGLGTVAQVLAVLGLWAWTGLAATLPLTLPPRGR